MNIKESRGRGVIIVWMELDGWRFEVGLEGDFGKDFFGDPEGRQTVMKAIHHTLRFQFEPNHSSFFPSIPSSFPSTPFPDLLA